MATSFSDPRWLQDLRRFLPLKSQFVLTGNVRDRQASELAGTVTPLRFDQTLATALFAHGYGQVVLFDLVRGFHELGPSISAPQPVDAAEHLAIPAAANLPAGPEVSSAVLPQAVRPLEPRWATQKSRRSRVPRPDIKPVPGPARSSQREARQQVACKAKRGIEDGSRQRSRIRLQVRRWTASSAAFVKGPVFDSRIGAD